MKKYNVRKISELKEVTIDIPSDKSISHRSILLNLLSGSGKAKISNFLFSRDTLASIDFARSLGADIKIDEEKKEVLINIEKLHMPFNILNCENSGTTVRLAMCVLAALGFSGVFTGDDSLKKRPMGRITDFLKEMGANVETTDGKLPVSILDSKLKRIKFNTDLGSAQQKSAFIIANLFAEGERAEYIFEKPSRDHTELMLKAMGADIKEENNNQGRKIIIEGNQKLQMRDFTVPGDFSSAAFFIVLALLSDDLCIHMKGVNLNPTRAKLLDILLSMGANIEIKNKKRDGLEDIGDIIVKSSKLKGIVLEEKTIIPYIIDEIPVLALLMAFADSPSKVCNVEELRVKESDRLEKICDLFSFIGVDHNESYDSFEVFPDKEGKKRDFIKAEGDHRIIMCGIIASAITGREIMLDDIQGVEVSFPEFFERLKETGYDC